VLLYVTEACPFLARDQSSVSFTVASVLIILFALDQFRDVTEQCQVIFGMLPIHQVFMRKVRLLLG